MVGITSTDGYVLNMEFRMPFHFGDTEVVSLPHLFLTVEAEIDGERVNGMAAEGLSPLWFVKGGDRSFADGIDQLLAVVDIACNHAVDLDAESTVFDLWHATYEVQEEWGERSNLPPLLWGFGVTLVERALIDAFCRYRGDTFAETLATGGFGIEPGRIYPELDGVDLTDCLTDQPARSATLRHTIGFTDPLTEGDLGEGDNLDDGLPQTLVEYLDAHALDHFKIKLSGDPDADADRLEELSSLFDARGLDDYVVTLDANEQYADATQFRSGWDVIAGREGARSLLDKVAYIEQPLDRHEAMTDEAREVFTEWTDRPPIIIDESDAKIDSLGTALEHGYAGTSHKNCKGVFRSLINACLLEQYREENPQATYVLSGEDLTTVAPVGLQQDLAVTAVLGMDHIERNGHHYFSGLSMLPDDLQDRVLSAHGDLYREHEAGTPVLDVTDGEFAFGSAVDAPFGYALDFDPSRFTPMSDYSFDPS